jgi:ribosomal protein S27E
MGDRYFIPVNCPDCGYIDKEAYYAPTCGFLTWTCPNCKHVVDLEELTGISEEDASNAAEIQRIVCCAAKNWDDEVHGEMHLYCPNKHILVIPIFSLYMYLEEDGDATIIKWTCPDCGNTYSKVLYTTLDWRVK